MIDVTKKEQSKSDIATHTIILKGSPLKPVVLTDIVMQKPQEAITPEPEIAVESVMFEIY